MYLNIYMQVFYVVYNDNNLTQNVKINTLNSINHPNQNVIIYSTQHVLSLLLSTIQYHEYKPIINDH